CSLRKPIAWLVVSTGPFVWAIRSQTSRSTNRPKPSQSWKQPILLDGLCWRSRPKTVGKIPPGPTTVGVIGPGPGLQSFERTPYCSGPAPMIIDAQLGLLTVGITPRACNVEAPSAIIRCRTGVLARRIPSGLSPSTPITTKCSTPGTCAPACRGVAPISKNIRPSEGVTRPYAAGRANSLISLSPQRGLVRTEAGPLPAHPDVLYCDRTVSGRCEYITDQSAGFCVLFVNLR